MKKIFIDGRAGTTGLRIYERLGERNDIEILTLSEEDRKNPKCRKEMLNSADIAFLCLPDDAAKEAVLMTENPDTVIIDTSTAHRTNPDWVYAFPELSKQHADALKTAKRIAVPGCHASGFIALIYPLIKNGYLDKSVKLSCHSITGYSGGGKKMILQYNSADADSLLCAPRQYGLTQNHKHLPEMQKICQLDMPPIFCPIVSDFYSGMAVTIPIFAEQLQKGNIDDIKALYKKVYSGEIVKYNDLPDDDGLYSAYALCGKDSMDISVFGNSDRILLCARYDNLGKGASGAACEALNYVLNAPEAYGLKL